MNKVQEETCISPFSQRLRLWCTPSKRTFINRFSLCTMIHIDPLISSQEATGKQKVSAPNISSGSIYPVQLNHHPSPILTGLRPLSSLLLSHRNTWPGSFLGSGFQYSFLGTCTRTSAIEKGMTINSGMFLSTETANFIAKMLSRWLN